MQLLGSQVVVGEHVRVPEVDLYLASTSPRRRELLLSAGLRFQLCEPGAEYQAESGQHEHAGGRGVPVELARERAERKALGARRPAFAAPVLAVDTVVDLDGQELAKAADREAADVLLRQLLGRRHLVHTAHCLLATDGSVYRETATATVEFAAVGGEAVDRYLSSGAWRGKAGAYGIQDQHLPFASLVDGSLDTVVGLHLAAVRRLLAEARKRP